MNANRISSLCIAALSLVVVLSMFALILVFTVEGNPHGAKDLGAAPGSGEQIDMIISPGDLAVIMDPDDRTGKAFISR